MILDPVNSVASLDFYKKVAGQSFWRSLLYLCHLGGLFAVLCTFAIKLKVGPIIDETFNWLARSVPTMTYANGRVTSSSPGPLKLQHPRMPEIAVMIDTTRTDAVTPQQLEEAKVMAFLSASAFYLRHQSGKVEVYDLSKTPSGTRPLTIDPAFFRTANTLMSRVLYPLALVITFGVFLIWKLLSSLIYSVVALLINAIGAGGLAYSELFNIAVYAQTLVVFLQILALFLPFTIPALPLLSILITSVYLWLAVKRQSPSSPPALA